ncbi:MAG: bifunctional diaminohydroxyphosphoribosylaminopyrimidine deaminase/5-amino-6-(5-phosphoribosylamino)uracil reductase RibD [Candidatus Omnitrophica bacterium]|nr:bifunctional diaminohydroxyphosphoribosylaminopyrimidine deaminase/5-amino-6-(5-phosphoribosylamino)uracil reductase RibD [Candidatus Omnitrophota bacterium]
MQKTHEYFMQLALRLALKARGRTSPNPLVGALVVKKGQILGRGYHKMAGAAHAEIVALDEAMDKSKGATLYITLEPCTHFGRTPPCVDRIIKSGIREVVIGMVDPNPLNKGRGIEILKSHRIKVKVGILEEKLEKINEFFIKYISKKMPFVTVKAAQSLDGKIATRHGDSKWITSDKSRAFAHGLRRDYDAVMVGVNTVLVDNPRLDAWFSKKQPVKVIVDSQLSVPQDANIFTAKREVIIITLASKAGQETDNRRILQEKAKIFEVKEKAGQVNLRDALKKLARLNITSVLVEGGGTLAGSLFDEGLVDKVLFFISPKIIGGKDAISSVMGQGISRIDRAIKIKDVRFRRLGEDFLVEGYIK